jgi:hypothetical protein
MPMASTVRQAPIRPSSRTHAAEEARSLEPSSQLLPAIRGRAEPLPHKTCRTHLASRCWLRPK